MGRSGFAHYTDTIRKKGFLKKLETFLPQKNCRQQVTDYREYRLTWKEWGSYAALGTGVCGLLAYTFYRSMVVFFLFLPLGLLYPGFHRGVLLKKRQRELGMQFKEAILILAGRLSAGYSIENALFGSVEELELLYGKDGMIVREISFIAGRIRMNVPVEQLFTEFGIRSGLEDIRNFAEVFSVAKRSGGELNQIINHTANIIHDKMQVQEDILTITAAKRFEQKIMDLIPFLIIIYIDSTSPGFFSIMYQSVMGRIIMTICLGIYLAAYYLSGKILEKSERSI